MDSDEEDIYDELMKKNEIIQSLETKVIELLDENKQMKIILDRLKKKKPRGESIDDINGNLQDIIQNNLDYSTIFDILENFTIENHYKFINSIMIGQDKRTVPIAIYNDYFAYKENNSLKSLQIEKLPNFLCEIYKPIIKNVLDKKFEQHKQNNTEDIKILENIYKLGNNSQLLFNSHLKSKKIIKNYQC